MNDTILITNELWWPGVKLTTFPALIINQCNRGEILIFVANAGIEPTIVSFQEKCLTI